MKLQTLLKNLIIILVKVYIKSLIQNPFIFINHFINKILNKHKIDFIELSWLH